MSIIFYIILPLNAMVIPEVSRLIWNVCSRSYIDLLNKTVPGVYCAVFVSLFNCLSSFDPNGAYTCGGNFLVFPPWFAPKDPLGLSVAEGSAGGG